MAKHSKPPLSVVPLSGLPSPTDPPATLGTVGRNLWAEVMRQYAISDSGGLELLRQACHAADRAESLRMQIDRDGECLQTRTGLRDHPCLRHEIAVRGLVCRTLQRLGLDVEPLKPVGRPPRGLGISWRDLPREE
jgi:hypothetical protein